MVIGRSSECARIDRLLDDARRGRSGALVIRGEPGIGKSALLDYALSRADDARVTRALGVETESAFAFSGLHELLHPLLDRLSELPPVQEAALRRALALTDGQGVGQLHIGAATLSLLAAACEDTPLLCVIDDAHWLDQASADALTFAARRLEAEGVAMLFAARGPGDHAFRAPGVPELDLAGLAAEVAAAILERDADVPVAREVADQLVAATAGNPLALLALPRRLTREQLTGVEPLPHPLPVGDGLQTAFASEAGCLSEEAQRALVIAATADTRAMQVIVRAGATTRSAFEECEEAGLLAIADGQMSFSHPLVRSAVYQQATPAARRAAHRALADAFAGDERYTERRAWHAAAATVEPDEDVAAQLELTAHAARSGRGHIAAAAMFERAARLTPANEPRRRRLYLAARSAWLAGQPDRALRLLEDATGAATDATVRADLHHLHARIRLGRGATAGVTEDLVAEAGNIEQLDAARAAAMLATAVEAAPAGSRLELARRAVALADGRADAADLLANLALARALRQIGDRTEAQARLERATTTLAANPQLRADPELVLAAVETLAAFDVPDEETLRELLHDATVAARAHAVVLLPRALLHAAWLDFQAGRWTDAHMTFVECSRLADETGQHRERAAAVVGRAVVDALQGREADARAATAEIVSVSRPDARDAGWCAARVLSLLELGLGRSENACIHLERVVADSEHPVHLRGLPAAELDLAEAYIRAGKRDEAATAAAALGRDRSDNSAAWATALLADRFSFASAFSETRRRFAATPFLLARVRLNFGERLRREGARRDARDELRAALELFERLGATPWSERAGRELRASGETARRRQPNTADELTAQELQVARVVAAGASDKEAAAELFLSPKTIEYHLGKVYRKLRISSRRQLAHRLAEQQLSEAS